MARELLEVLKESVAVETQLLAYKRRTDLDLEAVRKNVRKNIILGNEIDQNDQLAVLLKKEYEIKREEAEWNLTREWAEDGNDPKTEIFKMVFEQQLLKEDLSLFAEDETETLRKSVRQDIVLGREIDPNNKLAVMLKREYELHRAIDKWDFSVEGLKAGKDINSDEFKYALELHQIKEDLSVFTDDEFVEKRKEIREQVSERNLIQSEDVMTNLLLRERGLERRLLRIELEEKYAEQGYDRNSDIFKKSVELDMLRDDMKELYPDILAREKEAYEEQKKTDQKINITNTYVDKLHKEFQLQTEIDDIKKAEEQKRLEEQQRQEELAREKEEAEKKQQEEIIKNLYTSEEPETKKRRTLGQFLKGLFSRKPKAEPAKEEAVTEATATTEAEKEEKENTEEQKTETVTKENEKEASKDDKEKEISKDDKEKEISKDDKTKEAPETEQKKALTPEELQAQRAKEKAEERKRKKEERERKYRVEFASKELTPEIRDCGDPAKLKEFLSDAANKNLKPEIREHLENRILANAKIQSLEEMRANKQKNRSSCIRFNDGTILLKNKKRDVQKQTTANGCWSCVLSDMLAHFGVDLSQEEIRAYRPNFSGENKNKATDAFMERLSMDVMHELNDMADLIQRTVPNVAQHHMSIGTTKESNKAVLKEKVEDALLNKNSPIALCYNKHYMSIVGIKGDTLIVQNPDPKFTTKWQKLSIDDLFAEANGQITLDWLEDLKFQKDGTCKNATSQWKAMGIECKNLEFAAGKEKNQNLHLKGNEYYDTYRLSQDIEETIYLPKMSFGREKDLAQVEINKQQLENVKEGIMTMEDIQKNEPIKDDLEIDEFDMR